MFPDELRNFRSPALDSASNRVRQEIVFGDSKDRNTGRVAFWLLRSGRFYPELQPHGAHDSLTLAPRQQQCASPGG